MENDAADGRGESFPDEIKPKRIYNLEERTARFGEAVVDFVVQLNRNPITTPWMTQLVRSATSVGVNYCEASEAGSDKEFWYRVSVSNREARETKY